MHGNKSREPGMTSAKDMLDGIEQSQASIEQFLQAEDFDQILALSEDLGVALQQIDLPAASITAQDRARLGALVRRNIDSARQVGRLLETARAARRKTQAALHAYKKY